MISGEKSLPWQQLVSTGSLLVPTTQPPASGSDQVSPDGERGTKYLQHQFQDLGSSNETKAVQEIWDHCWLRLGLYSDEHFSVEHSREAKDVEPWGLIARWCNIMFSNTNGTVYATVPDKTVNNKQVLLMPDEFMPQRVYLGLNRP